ncbi:MAG: hypothetical protein ACP6IQ_01930 [Candidatus Njordarchaeia archaeon]
MAIYRIKINRTYEIDSKFLELSPDDIKDLQARPEDEQEKIIKDKIVDLVYDYLSNELGRPVDELKEFFYVNEVMRVED